MNMSGTSDREFGRLSQDITGRYTFSLTFPEFKIIWQREERLLSTEKNPDEEKNF